MVIAIIMATIVVAILVAIAAAKHHERKNKRIESQRRETILKIIEHTSSIYDEISRYK